MSDSIQDKREALAAALADVECIAAPLVDADKNARPALLAKRASSAALCDALAAELAELLRRAEAATLAKLQANVAAAQAEFNRLHQAATLARLNMPKYHASARSGGATPESLRANARSKCEQIMDNCEGDILKTQLAAARVALEEAQGDLVEYLESQKPAPVQKPTWRARP